MSERQREEIRYSEYALKVVVSGARPPSRGSVSRVGGDAVFKPYSHTATGVVVVLVRFVFTLRLFAGRRLAPRTVFSRVTSVAKNAQK